MATKKRLPAKRQRAQEYEKQETIRLTAEMRGQIAEILRRAGLGTKAQVMREAMGIGLRELLRRYER